MPSMRPALVLAALLAVGAASVVVAPVDAGGDPVTVENGSTYEVGTELAFDVADDGSYELRTDDGAFLLERNATDGRVVVDTDSFRSGTYRLVDADTGETAYQVTLAGGDTPTPTPDPVVVTDGGSYDVGTHLRFDVDDGTYEIYTDDGAFVASRRASDGSLVVDTRDMDAGSYRLVRQADSEVVYEVRLVDGTATASATTTASPTATPRPRLATNGSTHEPGARLAFDVGAGTYELYTADGAFVATRRASDDGRVVVDTESLATGGYRIVDTDSGTTAATFTLSTDPPTEGTPDTPVTGTAPETPGTASTADSAERTVTSTATTAGTASDAPDATPSDVTTTGVPGFGVLAALAAVAVAVLGAVRRR